MNDRLDSLVHEADPAPQVEAEALGRVWARLEQETGRVPALAQRRARRGIAAAATVAATGLLVGAVAAGAAFVATRTGQQNPPEHVGLSGPGEVLNMKGTDYQSVAAGLAEAVAFPSGEAKNKVLGEIYFQDARHRNSPDEVQTTVGALNGRLARYAICTWVEQWQEAGVGTAAKATATEVLQGAPNWPQVTALEPWIFAELGPIVAAATSGDAAAMQQAAYGDGWCFTTWSGPDDLAELEARQPEPADTSADRPMPTPTPTARP